ANGRLAYYTNIGSPSAPVFASLDNPFNPSGIFAYNATPSFGDLDADGDVDAVVGDSDGVLHYFKNSGTSSAPALTEVIGAANPFDTFDVGRNATPTLTDLDGDGDLDLVVGEVNGFDLTYFLNTGTASAPVFVEQTGA